MDSSERSELLNRLARLDRELAIVRRELGERNSVAIPQGTFQAVRVQVAGEHFAVPSEHVRQIIRYARATRIPAAPRAVHGVLNLRGDVVVVLDVSERLNLGRTALDLRTPVVVARIQGWHVGLVVERVLDVVTLDGASLTQPSGAIASSLSVAAVGSVSGQLVQLFDLERLLSPAELEGLEHAIADSLLPGPDALEVAE
jgi:purine-binding chemotaxis protein CheW